MSWSLSKERFLPSLRPEQLPPAAASQGKPTALQVSQLQKSHSPRLENQAEPQSLPKPTSTGVKRHYFPLTTNTKHKEASTSDEVDPARPFKAPKISSKSSKHESATLSSSASPGQATSASAPAIRQPFFSLTKQELKDLRRSMGKGSSYVQFRDTTIARSLDHLGRGWDGYLRAKNMAEQDGKINEFWQHFSPELNTVVPNAQSPVGAISPETAAMAAQSNYNTCVGRLRPETAAEIRQLRMKSRSSLPDAGLAGQDSTLCDSTAVQIPSYSTPVPEADSQVCQRRSPDPVLSSRPKRVLQRPDYRIPPLLGSSPEPPSSPELPPRTLSPTPRELYDRTQPKFVQYPCEWKGCRASLNNLETLQKHIRVVHAEGSRDTLCCQWEICGTGAPRTYKSPKDLVDHFETAHLAPLKWRLGDGHKCHEVVAKLPGI